MHVLSVRNNTIYKEKKYVKVIFKAKDQLLFSTAFFTSFSTCKFSHFHRQIYSQRHLPSFSDSISTHSGHFEPGHYFHCYTGARSRTMELYNNLHRKEHRGPWGSRGPNSGKMSKYSISIPDA